MSQADLPKCSRLLPLLQLMGKQTEDAHEYDEEETRANAELHVMSTTREVESLRRSNWPIIIKTYNHLTLTIADNSRVTVRL